MSKTQRMRALAAVSMLATCSTASAADHVVSMLNTGKEGAMVFEPSYVRVAVGDTVIFKPVQPGGHNAVSLLVPDGAQPVDTQYPDPQVGYKGAGEPIGSGPGGGDNPIGDPGEGEHGGVESCSSCHD
jgi:plastocyanin